MYGWIWQICDYEGLVYWNATFTTNRLVFTNLNSTFTFFFITNGICIGITFALCLNTLYFRWYKRNCIVKVHQLLNSNPHHWIFSFHSFHHRIQLITELYQSGDGTDVHAWAMTPRQTTVRCLTASRCAQVIGR